MKQPKSATDQPLDRVQKKYPVKHDPECRTTTVPHAGRILGLSRGSAYAAAANGEIPTIRIGGKLLVPMAALEDLLKPA
jgi:excisionase family DNA binding protein